MSESPVAATGGNPPPADSHPKDRVTRLALRLISANTRLNIITLTTIVALVVLGVWAQASVKQSLREIRATGLQTVLDAELKALQLWIDDRKGDTTRWAADPRVRDLVVRLGAASSTDAAAVRRDFAAILQPLVEQSGGYSFNLIDRSGRIVSTPFPEYLGRTIAPGDFLADLAPVFEGRSRFIRPYPETERIGPLAAVRALSRPVVWFEAPVRAAGGEVIAALGVAHRADTEFAHILELARPGDTGEAYAFDAKGLMLTESRFVGELKRAGLLPDEPGASAVFRMEVRDPGQLRQAPPARAYTRLAAAAIAARGSPAAEARQGVLLEPYRNYRGAEVIGAWKWLPEYDVGVALELEAREAYAPLGYLNIAFTIILTLLVAVLGGIVWSTYIVHRLKRYVGDTRLIGQYRLERKIGEGGMSTVYLAQHALLKRPTALKMLKPQFASDELAARFEREVQHASRLRHPNTIGIYDYGRTADGLFYYVMEYLEGETLAALVTARGAMPAARVVHVLRQVCAALREAHGQGLIHRDIKPGNIMLCYRGGEHDVVKILDYGLVKDVEGRESRNITQFQKFLGTPLYMSPERIRDPADADVRADIYSVGAVGFYLATGRDLFSTAGTHDLVYHVLHTPVPRVSSLVPGVPPALDELLARCLDKERDRRPSDIALVLAALEALALEHHWPQHEAADWWREYRATASAATAA
jgi:eukaryotic-like serine/threonine-protein kinase